MMLQVTEIIYFITI